MVKAVVVLLMACAVALAVAPLGAHAAAVTQAPAATAGDAAVAYANALALGNTPRAWSLLSAKSQKETDMAQWQTALEQRPPQVKPQATTLLRAISTGQQMPVVVDQVVRAGEAYLEVKGTVPVTQRVVVVKDPAGWRVDLTATDALSSKAAGELFLQVMREETLASQGKGLRGPDSAEAFLRALLAPQAKDYKLVDTQPDGADRATVTVSAEVPVNLVLKATRSGAGWGVDFSRPLAQVDVFSPDPLKEAVGQGERQVCEDQLRQLAGAIQTYMSISDDMLPDPSRWLDQVAAYLPSGAKLHCPTDSASGVSYAMNKNLAGKRRREIANPSLVPLLFESTKEARNASDTGESWPATARHPGGNEVLYLDGSVRPAPTKPSFEVKKAPPGTVSMPMRPMGGGPGMMPGGPGGMPGGPGGMPGGPGGPRRPSRPITVRPTQPQPQQ